MKQPSGGSFAILLLLGGCLGLGAGETLGPLVTAEGRLPTPKAGSDEKIGGATAVRVERPELDYVYPLRSRETIPYIVDYQPTGLEFFAGRLKLFPRLETRLAYNDNIFGSGEGEERSDMLWQNRPGLDLTFAPDPSFQLRSYYIFGWNDYLDDVARDYLTHDAGASMTWRNLGVRGLDLNLRDQYSQSGNTAVLDNEYVSFTRLQENKAGPTVEYRRENLGFAVSYEYGIVDYFKATLQSSDYYTHAGKVLWWYEVMPNLVPYVRYDYKATRYRLDSGGDFDCHYLNAGVRANLGRKFNFDAFVGNHRGISLDPYDSNDGPSAGIKLGYTPRLGYTVYFNSEYRFWQLVRTGGTRTLLLAAGGRFRVLPEFFVDGRVSWMQDDRMDGIQQRTLLYRAQFEYAIRRDLRAYAGCNRAERATTGARDVIINEIFAGFNFRF